MGLSNLIETVLLLVVCVILPSALAMYFSIPPKSGTGSH